jgi:hypothetical protein
MAAPNQTAKKPKQKKKSASSSRSPAGRALRKKKMPAGENGFGSADLPFQSVGRMERTRRLLLAAIRVWELKQRPWE